MRALIFILTFGQLLHAQTWEQLPSFPGTPRDDAASFVIGDHIYVGTGMEVGWGLTNDWYRFDMISETWSQIASMPATPRQYCTTFTVWDTAYVFGGLDGEGALDELWAYYPEQDQWVQKASLPAEARYAAVGQDGLYSGVIATGMLASGIPTNDAWKYTPSMNNWEQITAMTGVPRHRAASFQGGGGIMVCGGADADFQPLDDCWYYPLAFETGDWYVGPMMPAPRYGHRGAEFMVVIGGASETFQFHDDVWRLSSEEPESLVPFEGGLRRGGVAVGKSSTTPIVNTIYFGLGIGLMDDDFVRYNDWWKLATPVGMDEFSALTFTLFPNPTTDRITLQLSDQWNNATVSIHDALGRTMEQLALPADRMIDLNDLAPGRYEIVISSNDQRTLRAPLIKLE